MDSTQPGAWYLFSCEGEGIPRSGYGGSAQLSKAAVH